MYKNRYSSSSKPQKLIKLIIGICAVALIIGAVILLQKLGGGKSNTVVQPSTSSTTISTITSDRFVGKKIMLAGDVSVATDTVNYSHTLTLTGGEKIALMSSTLDLFPYKGLLFIDGTVAKFDGKTFIIDVASIGSSADTLNSVALPTSSSSRVFPFLGVTIDLTAQKTISYSFSGEFIIIAQEGGAGNVVVRGFRCETGFPGKDCDTLTTQYSGGSFVSAGGMTYSKGSGTKRFARHAGGFGYLIDTPSDAMLYAIANILIPLNEAYINARTSDVKKLCGISSPVKPIIKKESLTSWTMQIDDCLARITLGDSGENITIVSQGSQPTPTTTGKTTTQAPTSTPVTELAGNTGSAPKQTTSGYTYTNVKGGYAITYPSADVSYTSALISESFGIKDLLCYVRYDIKRYADRDNAALGPAVLIYECISKLPSGTLMSKMPGYYFQTNNDGTKLFFTKVLNSEWKEFAKKIQVQ